MSSAELWIYLFIFLVQIELWFLFERTLQGYASKEFLQILLKPIRCIGAFIFLLFFLSLLGVKVRALVVGFGLGGIALMIAVRASLKNLASSVSLISDLPFDIGDLVYVDDLQGTVERIGFFSTHIRSRGGELLIYPNAYILDSQIKNYTRMNVREVYFTICHDAAKLEGVHAVVKDVIERVKGCTFLRVNLLKIEEGSCLYEISYLVHSSDSKVYMDIQQEINFGLKRGLDFARSKCNTAIYLSD